jgi:hypothetical protein
MANFGVYFNIINNTGATLGFMRADLDDATYVGPTSIPSQVQPTVIHLNDPYFGESASGTIYFLANVGGQLRQYAWYGSPEQAAGPGITSWPNGYPTSINIFIDANTPGWTPWPFTTLVPEKNLMTGLSGKLPADSNKALKFT